MYPDDGCLVRSLGDNIIMNRNNGWTLSQVFKTLVGNSHSYEFGSEQYLGGGKIQVILRL